MEERMGSHPKDNLFPEKPAKRTDTTDELNNLNNPPDTEIPILKDNLNPDYEEMLESGQTVAIDQNENSVKDKKDIFNKLNLTDEEIKKGQEEARAFQEAYAKMTPKEHEAYWKEVQDKQDQREAKLIEKACKRAQEPQVPYTGMDLSSLEDIVDPSMFEVHPDKYHYGHVDPVVSLPVKPQNVFAHKFTHREYPGNIRLQIAHDFFINNPPGNYFMSKTTRVGCTTNMITAAHDLGLKVLAIEPTNSIGETTIIEDVPQFCEKEPVFTQLLPNQYCSYNQLRVVSHKDDKFLYETLTKIPIMSMKKDCRDCRDFEWVEVDNPPEACLNCYDDGACVTCGRLFHLGKTGCKNCGKIEMIKWQECKTCKKVPEPCRNCWYKDCIAYKRCRAVEILKKPIPETDIAVGTAQKMSILMQRYQTTQSNRLAVWRRNQSGESTLIEDILASLNADVVLFDELHMIQFMELANFSIKKLDLKSNISQEIINLDKYLDLENAKKDDVKEVSDDNRKYPCLAEIIRRFRKIQDDIFFKLAVDDATKDARAPDYIKRHIRKTIFSPCIDDITGSQLWVFGGLLTEIMTLVESLDFVKFNLNFDQDILPLYDMATIVSSTKIVLSAIRSVNDITVTMSAADMSKTEMLNMFCKMLQWNKMRWIIFTSATVDETTFNFNDMFEHGNNIKRVTFGKGGDPLNTNAKCKVFAHSLGRSVYTGKRSIIRDRKAICESIVRILDKYEDRSTCKWDEEKGAYRERNVKIILPNIESAEKYTRELEKQGFPHKVTYYRADDTLGVRFDGRIVIAVGLSWKPANAFDTITDDREESDILNLVSTQSDSWQAWSRAKCPHGIVPSAIVVFGATEKQCEGVITWGSNRKIEVIKSDDFRKGTQYKITSGGDITRPALTSWRNKEQLMHKLHMHLGVIPCIDNPIESEPTKANTFLNNLTQIEIFSECEQLKTQEQENLCKEPVTDFEVKVPVLNYNSTIKLGTNCPKSVTGFRRSEVIRMISAGNPEPFSTQTHISTGDRITLNTRAPDGTTTFVRFSDIQKDKVHKLHKELINCPFISEIEPKGGGKYIHYS
jgi:hypothetical protein